MPTPNSLLIHKIPCSARIRSGAKIWDRRHLAGTPLAERQCDRRDWPELFQPAAAALACSTVTGMGPEFDLKFQATVPSL
jgi:hypothetical protein